MKITKTPNPKFWCAKCDNAHHGDLTGFDVEFIHDICTENGKPTPVKIEFSVCVHCAVDFFHPTED